MLYISISLIMSMFLWSKNGIADITDKSYSNASALQLFEASKSGDLAQIKALITTKADINARDDYFRTALMLASQHGHIEIVHELLEANADINAKDGYGMTALMIAAQYDNVPIVQALLASRGLDINALDLLGNTALILASENGNTSVVEALLAAKANKLVINKLGSTALQLARNKGHADVVKLLNGGKPQKDLADKTKLTNNQQSTNKPSDAFLPSWPELVQSATTLKERSSYVPKFKELRVLQYKERGDGYSKASSIAGLRPEVATAFARYIREGDIKIDPKASEAARAKTFRAYDDVTNAFSTQIKKNTTCNDLPFLAYLANTEIVSAVEIAILQRIEKCLTENRDAVLGLILVGIEEAVGPWGIERFAKFAASSGDKRALPELVHRYSMSHAIGGREPVVNAIAKIDPNQRFIAGYFAWADHISDKDAYNRHAIDDARSLRQELTRSR